MKSIKLTLSAMLFSLLAFVSTGAWADASAPTSIIAEDSGTAPYFDSLEDCEQYRKLPGKKKTYVPTTLAKKEFPGGGEWKRYRPGPSGACFGGAKVWQNGKVVTKTVVMFAHESAKTDFWWNGSFGLMNFCNNFFSDLSGDYSPVTDEQGVVGADIMPPPAPVSCEGECERNRRKMYCEAFNLPFNQNGDDDGLGSCSRQGEDVKVEDNRRGIIVPGANLPPACQNCGNAPTRTQQGFHPHSKRDCKVQSDLNIEGHFQDGRKFVGCVLQRGEAPAGCAVGPSNGPNGMFPGIRFWCIDSSFSHKDCGEVLDMFQSKTNIRAR